MDCEYPLDKKESRDNVRLYKNLLVGDQIRYKKYQVIWKLKHNKIQLGVYIILLAPDPQNLMEIIPASLLRQSYYQRQELFVLGIAGSKEEAYEIARQLIEEVYRHTGGTALREYIQ